MRFHVKPVTGPKQLGITLITVMRSFGGAEAHTAKLARALIGRGHRVRMLALGGRYPTWIVPDGLETMDASLRKPVEAMSFREWRDLLRRVPGEVGVLAKGGVHVGSLKLDLAARNRFRRYYTIEHSNLDALPRKASRRHFGGLVPGLGLGWYRAQWEGRIRSFAPHRVICVSDAVQNVLQSDYRFPSRKLVTVHNGADPTRFRPDPELRAACRRAWGVPEDCLLLGTLGRLSAEKRLHLAMEALGRLRTRSAQKHLRLAIVGDGLEEQALHALARRMGVHDAVVFAGFTSRPWEALCALDIFLMPSSTEGLPLALCEAMACGCCCIASDVGGIPEVIADSRVGTLVPAGDPQALFDAVERAVEMPREERLGMGARARAHVTAEFNEKTQLDRIAAIIEGGLSRGTLAESLRLPKSVRLQTSGQRKSA